MRASEITIDWINSINFKVKPLRISPTIEGVLIKDLQVNLDGRGEVTELWSRPWLEAGFAPIEHVYQSATDFGVVKCWHYHEIHTDQFTVTRGKLQVTLVDLRENSSSFGDVNVVFLGTLKPRLLKIPPMVMHGWKALSHPEVLVVNLQTHTYDPTDEYKLPWDCLMPEIWEPNNG